MSYSKLIFPLIFISYFAIVSAINVSYDGRALTIDGKRRILVSGSIHYPRSTPEMWPDLVKKAKEGGLDVIDTYVFWNAHEPQRRKYDFSGNLDVIRFIKAVQAEGLYLLLRIGPYVCAEWNNGGLPLWLQNIPGMEMRTANALFMNEMQNFTTLIVDMMKKEKLFASQGGNIILAQIENEYGNAMGIFGLGGEVYLNWCAALAEYLDIGVPWIMCQQNNAPEPIINTCNGFYCDQFKPNRDGVPKMWTENWTGWFKNWGNRDPIRTAEDIAFSVARFYQLNGTFQNYYMYHGGTNYGRTNGGAYITTSYDYNAPLNEYGQLNQPKYGHLKQLHDVLHSLEDILTHGNATTTWFDGSTTSTVYTLEDGSSSSCFLANINNQNDSIITFQGTNYSVPAWSVSILPDCKTVAYNTARVNTQTSIMVKESDKDGLGIAPLKWSWKTEEQFSPSKWRNGLKKTTWSAESVPTYMNLTWYKTTFQSPAGTDPVVVDLLGLGKGEAWVNGNSLGLYWPAYLADNWSCQDSCDYRGAFYQTKCVQNCGNATQRWYYVPRSFLKDGNNTLLLFEEMGGDPTVVSFKTVRPGTVCGNAYENNALELSCEGHPITAVNFASFGNPTGRCGAGFRKGSCESKKHALSIIEKECVGKEKCSVNATEDVFGSSNCGSLEKRLVVEVVC